MSTIEIKRQPRSLRPREEAPFCWFARAALDWIDKSPKITNQSRAKLVYVAGHVVEASRRGKPVYRVPKALIARHAGVSVRTVTAANAELEAAGLIVIERHFNPERKQHDLSTYTLCSVRPGRSGNARPTPGENQRREDSPTIKRNLKVAPAPPGVLPAPAERDRGAAPAGATASRPILNTW